MSKSDTPKTFSAHNWSYWLSWVAFEIRLSVSWIWLAPIVSVGGMFVVLNRSSISASSYPFVIRTLLELGLPILGVFLVVPLLSREWEQGTLVQLALRKPLLHILLLRLLLCLLYLTLVVIITSLVSLANPRVAPGGSSAIQWVASVVLTTMAPTLLLAAFALLTTHITCSASSGYLLMIGYWFANILAENLPRLSILRPFLLFSWTFPPLSNQIDWFEGKIILCIASIILLVMQFPLLTKEARLIQNKWE
jgi:hypothetical protein